MDIEIIKQELNVLAELKALYNMFIAEGSNCMASMVKDMMSCFSGDIQLLIKTTYAN